MMMRRTRGEQGRIDKWGGSCYDHLAALFLGEEHTKAIWQTLDKLGRGAQRERWLRILAFAKKIDAPIRRRRATKKASSLAAHLACLVFTRQPKATF